MGLLPEEVGWTETFDCGGYLNTLSSKEMVDGGNGKLEGGIQSFLRVKLREGERYKIKNTIQN